VGLQGLDPRVRWRVPTESVRKTTREERPISRLQHLREPQWQTRRCSGATVGDSPRGPLKPTGESPLKTHDEPKLSAPHLNTQGRAHAAVAPTAHRDGPLKDPLEQAPPRSRAHASPRAGSASLEGARLPRAGSAKFEGARLPRAGSASLEGLLRPRAGSASLEGVPRARARPRTRVRAFNALTVAVRRHHEPGAHAPVLSHQLPRREPIPATVGDCAAWPVPTP
jgi:hypothetical protein